MDTLPRDVLAARLALLMDDKLLGGDRRIRAERAREALEGIAVAVNAADLLSRERVRRLAEPWLDADRAAAADAVRDTPAGV